MLRIDVHQRDGLHPVMVHKLAAEEHGAFGVLVGPWDVLDLPSWQKGVASMMAEERLQEYINCKQSYDNYIHGKIVADLDNDFTYHRLRREWHESLRGYINSYDPEAEPKAYFGDPSARKTAHKLFDAYCEESLSALALIDAPEDAVADGLYATEEDALEAGKREMAFAEGILSVARDLNFIGVCGWEL